MRKAARVEQSAVAQGEDRHPPGRRRLRSAVRADGYETWTIERIPGSSPQRVRLA